MKIDLVMTGRSYHLADQLPESLELPEGSTLDDALGQIRTYLSEDQALPTSCLIAVSGQHVGTMGAHESRTLRDGDEITLIAPVAGG